MNILMNLGMNVVPARIKGSPWKRRVVIRVESAETQEYVSEHQGLEEVDVEEMVELNFIPSTVSEELRILHTYDKECSDKGFKFYQLAAVVCQKEQRIRSMCAVNVT